MWNMWIPSKLTMEWLGFKWEGEPRYASDYFDALYGYAIELIKKGLAYVDELSPDEMREYRGTLTEPGKTAHIVTALLKKT